MRPRISEIVIVMLFVGIMLALVASSALEFFYPLETLNP